jgi:hypothetical protein
MRRSLVLSILLLVFAQKYVAAAPTTQPDLIVVDQLNPLLKIRAQAPSLFALLQSAKPNFIFGDGSLLWVRHNVDRTPVFAMDRIYNLQIGKQQPAFYLLESHDYYLDSPDDADFIYTHYLDEHSKVVARDPLRGVVYQALWISAPQSGSGGITETRNIFLLCDGKHRWRFLCEGPVGESGALGADEDYSDSVKADVRWTGNDAVPVNLSFTLLTTHNWRWDSGGHDFSYDSITERQKMVPGPVDTGGYEHPQDAVDFQPGSFVPQGPKFIIATKDESLDSLIWQILREQTKPAAHIQKDGPLIAAFKASLKMANPDLTDRIAKEQTIILPSNAP